MAKKGLDYFPLAVSFDDKIELIEAEFGLPGIAIVVKLLQKIYREQGYYCDWNEEVALLFSRKTCLLEPSAEGGNVVSEVIRTALKRDVFSSDMFDKYGIITSVGIQERYFEAVKRRENIEVVKDYLLINAPLNMPNVNINSKNVCRNEENVCRNRQSKVKESKVNNKNNVHSANALFECLWKLYPNKRGKGQVSDSKKMQLLKIGQDEMTRAIQRYSDDLKVNSWKKAQNGSTFFNSGYVDYLDDNYVPSKPSGNSQSDKFKNFDERRYDYDKLEDDLLRN